MHSVEIGIAIKDILASMPENEQTAVIMRAQGYTMQEIADQFKVHKSTISRMFGKICNKHAESCVTVYEDKWSVNVFAENE